VSRLYSGGPGARALAANFDRAAHEIRHGLDRPLLKAGLVVAGQWMRNISGPRPGRLGVVTNRYRGSISAVIVRYGTVKIGTNVEYAPIHHQKGGAIVTRRSSRGLVHQARYPYRPGPDEAIDTKRDDVIRIVREVYAGPLRIGGQEVAGA
jgi:hypothetical protein